MLPWRLLIEVKGIKVFVARQGPIYKSVQSERLTPIRSKRINVYKLYSASLQIGFQECLPKCHLSVPCLEITGHDLMPDGDYHS